MDGPFMKGVYMKRRQEATSASPKPTIPADEPAAMLASKPLQEPPPMLAPEHAAKVSETTWLPYLPSVTNLY
jgi:hypothetical protein